MEVNLGEGGEKTCIPASWCSLASAKAVSSPEKISASKEIERNRREREKKPQDVIEVNQEDRKTGRKTDEKEMNMQHAQRASNAHRNDCWIGEVIAHI